MPTRTEEVASKVMGTAKAAKAAVKGLYGVFGKLTEEHGELKALLLRVKVTSDADVRRDLFPTIRVDLLSHEQGELREVYSVFANYPELEGMARAHGAEVDQIEQLLNQLGRMSYADPAWGSTFDELYDRIKRHTEEEENRYFPAAVRVLGQSESERLKGRYEATKAEITRGAT